MRRLILTLNAGSSSLKFALFAIEAAGSLALLSKGKVEAEEADRVRVTVDGDDGFVWSARRGPVYAELIRHAESLHDGHKVVAVGHRVVHGGSEFVRPVAVTEDILQRLEDLTPLAPLHQPHNLAPIRALRETHPDLLQVACFDTAFHRGRDPVTMRFALPREYEAMGIERYGFHGLSYEYIASVLPELAPRLAAGRVVIAHLGNGASLCALRHGRSVDTTMSFTALDGIPMGTRPGAIDPGVLLYLLRARGMSVDQLEALLYQRSGLLGVSGVSSDMRVLLASKDPHAAEAIDLFTFRIAREIGALAATLGGLDGLVFTAGIGENAAEIRRQVCARSAWLGLALDDAANGRGALTISAASSRVQVLVIPTDEEAMIARHTFATAQGNT
jgi:acetate kinase